MVEQLIAAGIRAQAAPAGVCRLYLVRHGTTTMNVENRYRGRRDIPLDAQGYQDAVDAARRLSTADVAAVYTGPLRRTIATAQIIADEARVPDIRILHGLNNVDYGAWEGMTADEAAMFDPEAFHLYRTSPSRAVCPVGERLSDAQQRMVAALALIGSRHAGESVTAVTHAVMIRLAVAKLTGIDDESWRLPVGRGSLTEVHIANSELRFAGLPDGGQPDEVAAGSSHLPALGGIVPLITTVPPHGGSLISLLAEPGRAAELTRRAARWPSWRLHPRQLCDLELLACGGFSPLRTFLGEDDYRAVCDRMRLADGTLWPIPIALDVPEELLAVAGPGRSLALRDGRGALLAVLHVTEAWRPDVAAEAAAVFGTTDPAHPGVDHLLRRVGNWYVSGELEAVRLPEHRDFRRFRHTPAQLRAEFARRGWHRVVAFQTRNPMHRAHQELTLRAAREAGARLLIHPVVGVTKPGDIDPGIRVRCYQAILPGYPDGALLSLLPLAMRMAGPREALWHAIIRKNYGATHLIVGRDHAGPGPAFYQPYAAQELVRRHCRELGMQVMTFPRLVYHADTGRYLPEDEVPPGGRVLTISGTQLRQRLADGDELPSWFMPPEVAAVLRRSYPLRTAASAAVRHRDGDALLTAGSAAAKEDPCARA